MDHPALKTAIIRIELIWSTGLKEKSGDPRSYEYIASQVMALKRAVLELRTAIEETMGQGSKEKLRYQKLHRSLSAVLADLDIEQKPCKDEAYIQDILDRFRKISQHIRIITSYQ